MRGFIADACKGNSLAVPYGFPAFFAMVWDSLSLQTKFAKAVTMPFA